MGDIHITSTLIKKTTLLAPVFSHKNKLYPTCNTVDGVCLLYILNKGSLWYLIISVQIFSFKTEKMLFQPRGANRKLRPFVQGSLLNQSFFGGPIPTHLPSVCSESSTGPTPVRSLNCECSFPSRTLLPCVYFIRKFIRPYYLLLHQTFNYFLHVCFVMTCLYLTTSHWMPTTCQICQTYKIISSP